MMKRTLSLVLCLVMVLGLAVPSVQASSTDNVYTSDNIMDNIVIEDGSNVEIVVDGNTVSTSQDTKLPNPADLVTDATEPAAPVVPEAPVLEAVCKCVDLASAVDHFGVCLVKAPYMELCEASTEELYAQWGTYSAVEQSFLLGYLQEKFPLKHFDLQKLLTAPTGAASETLTDGTTVSVEGIPQDGSLTVGEAADEVKDIVDAYVAENAEASSPLFGYDVSVQDGEGADWQPDTNVKMELELPGEKLHKNTKVFVVHVDDNGVATTIEAEVTEDGKIAFETPGFSAFYGFTVDFHYEDVVFSIPGMSSIKLSELFAELNVPLNASDVVALDYTDDTQLKIEQLEGDWLLTSLKAFSTEEKLTMTMADGTVHEIKVTDAEVTTGTHKWHLYNGYYGDYNHIYSETRFPYNDGYDSSYGSAYNSIFNGEFTYAYNHAAGSYYYWDSYDDSGPCSLFFDDVNQVTTINLASKTNKQTVYLDMIDEFVIKNCNVTLQVASDSSSTTKEIVIRSHNPAKPLFSIVNGSLTIKGSANTKIVLEFGANSDGTPKNLNQTDKFPLIWENGSKSTYKTTSRALYLENVTFRHSAYSGIDLYYSQMTSVTLKNCSFESTVDNVSHGGAIRIRDSKNLDLSKFELDGCSFDGNHADARGGAIALQRGVGTFTIKDSKFSNASASTHGGAISLVGDVGSISITGTKTAKSGGGYDYTTSFTNCTSVNRGGAVGANCSSFGDITVQNILVSGNEAGSLGGGLHFGNTDAKAPITGGAVSVSNCDFKDNMAHGLGGGLCVTDGEYQSISVTSCTFDNCDTTGYGGALGLKVASEGSAVKFSVVDDLSIIGCSFTNCLGGNLGPNAWQEGTTNVPVTWDHDGDPSTPEIDQFNGASGGGAIIIGGNIGGKITIEGADEDHPTLFQNCLTWNNGGAIFLNNDLDVTGKINSETNEIEAISLRYLNIDKCFARDAGNAVYLGATVIPKLDMSDCTVQNCGFFDADDPNFPDELVEISKEWFSIPSTNPGLVNTWLTYDKESFYLGTDYSGTFRTVGNTSCAAQITDCDFNNNRSYSNGGAVYWNANRVVYNDPTTKQNPRVTPSLTITNTDFDHNYAIGYGGAIFCEGSVTVESCELSYNTSNSYGGAIAQNVYNNSSRQLGESGDNESTSLILKAATGGQPVKIHHNSSGYGGGIAIIVRATDSYPHTVPDGAVDKPANWVFKTNFTYAVDFQLGGSHVYENTATHDGGGIFYETIYYLDRTDTPGDGVAWTERQRQVDSFVKDIKIDDGLIYSNTAGYGATADNGGGGNGGGIYMNSNQVNTEASITEGQKTGSSSVTITGGSIYNNTATVGNGGGVYLTGFNAVCSVTGGVIGATAKADDTPDVASPNTATSGTVTVDGVDTTVGGNGGGIAIFGGARIEMAGGYIVNNTCNVAGGGIAVHNSTMSLEDGTIQNNKSLYGGGISVMNGGDVATVATEAPVWGMEFSGGTISDNFASSIGGGICLSSNSTMKLDGGNVLRNYAATATTNGDETTYTYTAGQWGGGIAVCQGSYMDILGGTVDTNHAYDGGGIAISGKSEVKMGYKEGSTVGGTISNNTAAHNGGGVWVNGTGDGYNTADRSKITISGGTIETNTATNDGGGVFLGVAGYFKMEDGKISGNTGVLGGGICTDPHVFNNSDIVITNGEISGNTASESGGGIYSYYSTKLTITGGDIINNEAKTGNGGGVVATYFGSFDFSNGNVSNNTAALDGGGLYLVSKNCNFSSGSISNNSARNGAGVFISGYTLKVEGGTISENTATGNGGGVYAAGGATAKILATATTHGEITKNQANNGGGIYVTGGADLTVTDGFITHNQAVQPAGVTVLGTAKGNDDNLYGTGGGICVTKGASNNTSTFTLTGNDMAIYSNTATFAADDVFSSGNNTQLDIPEVAVMNLAGYGFNPEGWVEDYATSDESYTSGLNMIGVYASGFSGDAAEAILATPVLRYRNAAATQRRYMLVKPEYVTGKTASNTAVDGEYANKPNAYVCITLGIPTALDDTVVIDYASPVNINLWLNDLFMNEADFAKDPDGLDGSLLGYIFPDSAPYYDGTYYSVAKKDGQAVKPLGDATIGSLPEAYGIVYNGFKGVITYAPKAVNMDAEDSFFYVVEHNEYWYYAKVNVVPATTIYYEDNFGKVKYHTQADSVYDTLATWETVNGSSVAQDEDRPGEAILEGLDADSIYGYDSHYTSFSTYSSGSVHKVSVDRTKNARATFTFTGTGFDIISLCNANTGMVTVSIYDEDYNKIVFDDDPTTDKWEPTDPYMSWMVDTYYETGTNLYQVPIIKASDLPYDTYVVEIYVAPGWIPGEASYDGGEFYLDAIRIYDPAGLGGSNSSAAKDAYEKDNELWPVYAELRNMFLTQTDLDDGDTVNGILFIDGGSAINKTPTISEYRSWGPNNEVYLASGQSLAFTLNASNYAGSGDENGNLNEELVTSIHLGMRSLSGKGSVTITDNAGHTLSRVDDPSTTANEGLSATDMYYNISDMINNVVIVTNSGTNPIAISNLKVTHNAEPVSTMSLRNMFTMTQRDAQIALDILTADELAEPAITPKYPALSFEGMVCYNVFFDAQDLGNLTEADLGLAVFDTNDTEGTVETAKDVIYGATKVNDLYMVATNGIHAKYLGDTQYFRAFAKQADGSYIYSKMVSYSALDYAKNVLAKDNDVKLKQLVVAMLNYGAEAQKFFGYKTDDLMNKALTADDQALLAGFDATSLNTVGTVDASKVGNFVSNKGFTKRTPAISFKGAFEINYFFKPAYAVDGDMTLYFWNEDTYNNVSELTVDNADKTAFLTIEDGMYFGSSDEIIAKDLDKTVYVAAVYESNGVTYCSGVLPYSIATYCQNAPADVQALANAAAVYGCTAKQYFGA